MAINKASVLAEVKLRLDISDTSKDNKLNSFINQIEKKIFNYCNIEAIPDALFYTWVDMVVGFYQSQNSSSGEIKSVQRGDTTIEYSTSKNSSLDSIVSSNSSELNKYRKLKVMA